MKKNSNDEIQCDRQHAMTRVNKKHQHWNKMRWGQNRTANSTRCRDEFQCIHTKQRKPTTSATRASLLWQMRAQIKLAQRINLMIKINQYNCMCALFRQRKKIQHFTKSEYRSLICCSLLLYTHVCCVECQSQSDRF